MCGICGVIGGGSRHELLVRSLLALNQSRGRDGVGYLVRNKTPNENGAHWIYDKSKKTAMDYLADETEGGVSSFGDARISLCHTRGASNVRGIGSSSDLNSHPFVFGKITGAHNGCIRNWSDIEKQYNIKRESKHKTKKGKVHTQRSPIAVDSEVIFFLLDKFGPEKLSELEGPAAIWWWNQDDPTKVFLRNWNKDLAIHKSKGLIAFSSDIDHLRVVGLDGEEIEDDGTIHIIDTQKYTIAKGEKIEGKKVVYSSSSDGEFGFSQRGIFTNAGYGCSRRHTSLSTIAPDDAKKEIFWHCKVGPYVTGEDRKTRVYALDGTFLYEMDGVPKDTDECDFRFATEREVHAAEVLSAEEGIKFDKDTLSQFERDGTPKKENNWRGLHGRIVLIKERNPKYAVIMATSGNQNGDVWASALEDGGKVSNITLKIKKGGYVLTHLVKEKPTEKKKEEKEVDDDAKKPSNVGKMILWQDGQDVRSGVVTVAGAKQYTVKEDHTNIITQISPDNTPVIIDTAILGNEEEHVYFMTHSEAKALLEAVVSGEDVLQCESCGAFVPQGDNTQVLQDGEKTYYCTGCGDTMVVPDADEFCAQVMYCFGKMSKKDRDMFMEALGCNSIADLQDSVGLIAYQTCEIEDEGIDCEVEEQEK